MGALQSVVHGGVDGRLSGGIDAAAAVIHDPTTGKVLGTDDLTTGRALCTDDLTTGRVLGTDDLTTGRVLGTDDLTTGRVLGTDDLTTGRVLGTDDLTTASVLGTDGPTSVAKAQGASSLPCAEVDTELSGCIPLHRALMDRTPTPTRECVEVDRGNVEQDQSQVDCRQKRGCNGAMVDGTAGAKLQHETDALAARHCASGQPVDASGRLSEAVESANPRHVSQERDGELDDDARPTRETIEERAQRLNLIQFQRGQLSKHDLLFKAALRSIRRQKRR
jgi:hypothetical protein